MVPKKTKVLSSLFEFMGFQHHWIMNMQRMIPSTSYKTFEISDKILNNSPTGFFVRYCTNWHKKNLKMNLQNISIFWAGIIWNKIVSKNLLYHNPRKTINFIEETLQYPASKNFYQPLQCHSLYAKYFRCFHVEGNWKLKLVRLAANSIVIWRFFRYSLYHKLYLRSRI